MQTTRPEVAKATSSNTSTSKPLIGDTVGNSVDFQLAFEESLGFFDDISFDAWQRRKNLTIHRKHIGSGKLGGPGPEHIQAWYQQNWDPDFVCYFEDKIGGNSDGHKWVCDPHRHQELSDCLIYSVGSNSQFDFEKHLQSIAPNCEIHIFDPTDFSSQMVAAGLEANYHAWGLKSSYETALHNTVVQEWQNAQHNLGNTSSLEFKTLDETVKILRHEGRRIDIFKIDCEGCEWQMYRDLLRQDLRQILVETHSVAQVTYDFFEALHDAGYVMFHKEPNIQFGGGRCVEFSFLKLAKSYFEGVGV